MTKKTLIVSSYAEPEASRLGRAASERGWQVERADDPSAVSRTRAADALAFYGDTRFVVDLGERLGRRLIEPPLDFLARLPRRFTRRQVEYTTLDRARHRERPLFVKPADCVDKCFDPKVYQPGEESRVEHAVPEETPVLVSEPVRWGDEYRLIVGGGQVLDHSPYYLGGRIARFENGSWWPDGDGVDRMLDFAGELVAELADQLPPVFVLDVGEIEGGGWAVVEVNPLWCSSLYGCDVAEILPHLADCVTTTASRWSLERESPPRAG